MKFAGALVLALALGVNAFTPSTPRIVARTTLKSTTAPALEKTLATVLLAQTFLAFKLPIVYLELTRTIQFIFLFVRLSLSGCQRGPWSRHGLHLQG
jgi:hypothetical protein